MSNGRFLRPCDGPIHSEAGYRPGIGLFDYHYGVDMGQWNWAVRAMFNGTVISVVQFASDDWRVNVRHNGFITRYIHLRSVSVKVGDRLTEDDFPNSRFIGRIGLRSAPHVHVEYHDGDTWRGNASANIDRINSLIRGTPNDGSSNPPASTATASSSAPSAPASSSLTEWPRRTLKVRDFPVGTFWIRNSPGRGGSVVPNNYRHALAVALHGAGFPLQERSEAGMWRQIRSWLRGQHGYNTGPNFSDIAKDFQRYLTRQGHYKGRIDGRLGPQSIWAIIVWLNSIRPAYL